MSPSHPAPAPSATTTTRPSKTRRLAHKKDEAAEALLQSWTHRRSQATAFLQSANAVGQEESKAVAWSVTNLVAVPSPTSSSIAVTHFLGTPTPSTSTTSPSSRITFQIPLPAPSFIKRLSFSPCGGCLLATTDGELDGEEVLVWEQKECIDSWTLIWRERVNALGETGEDRKEVVALRWLGEGRKWYSTPPSFPTSRPLICAPTRSPPIVNPAVLLVLSSSELATPFTSTFAAPSTSFSNGIAPSPQTAIDDIVANLVNTIPGEGISPSAVVGALGLGTGEGATGSGKAMREELRNATGGGMGKTERVEMAAVGIARAGKRVEDLATTTFLIATSTTHTTYPTSTSPPLPATIEIPSIPNPTQTNGLEMNLESVNINLNDEGMDFSLDFLDSAFGSPPDPNANAVPTPAVAATGKVEDGKKVEAGRWGERKVELSEVKVELNAPGGPRVTTRPLAPLFLFDVAEGEENDVTGELIKLEWLENVELPGSVGGSEEAVDLKLLTVLAAMETETSQTPMSTMRTWALSNEGYVLSDAFQSLDCKKSESTRGEAEWVARINSTTVLPGLVSFVDPNGPSWGSFVAGITLPGEEGKEGTEVGIWDASTLERKIEIDTVQLGVLSAAAISPNHSLLCLRGFDDSLADGAPVIAALSLSDDDLATRLASAIVRQGDTTDLVGRVVGLKDDSRTLAITRKTAETVQAMLQLGRNLADTPLQLELLGLCSTLFSTSPALALRRSIAYDIIQLGACYRAFAKSEKTERSGQSGYRCESDAVWPLIGHLTWYSDFCKQLVEDCRPGQLGSGSPSARNILLLHPLPRNYIIKIAEWIIGLQHFLAAFPVGTNVMVDVSRSVLDDVVDYNGLVVKEWYGAVSQIATLANISNALTL
ncbi:hypothetical protein MNV49_004715 [Pseudohyphozyma bogoriensis]|nr:hypothetical protein MNV49_004715 [Pseudohyphozyma bogoriensis]